MDTNPRKFTRVDKKGKVDLLPRSKFDDPATGIIMLRERKLSIAQ